MTLSKQMQSLSTRMADLAELPDEALAHRYDLRHPRVAARLDQRLRLWLGRRLWRWGLRKPVFVDQPWHPGLKHAEGMETVKPLLIWALGAEPSELRQACCGFQDSASSLGGHAPVLLTDVADFAFFSRLAWLVEYLPEIPGEGEDHASRKLRYLARLYRGAPIVPWRLGLLDAGEREAVLRDALA